MHLFLGSVRAACSVSQCDHFFCDASYRAETLLVLAASCPRSMSRWEATGRTACKCSKQVRLHSLPCTPSLPHSASAAHFQMLPPLLSTSLAPSFSQPLDLLLYNPPPALSRIYVAVRVRSIFSVTAWLQGHPWPPYLSVTGCHAWGNSNGSEVTAAWMSDFGCCVPQQALPVPLLLSFLNPPPPVRPSYNPSCSRFSSSPSLPPARSREAREIRCVARHLCKYAGRGTGNPNERAQPAAAAVHVNVDELEAQAQAIPPRHQPQRHHHGSLSPAAAGEEKGAGRHQRWRRRCRSSPTGRRHCCRCRC